MQARRHVLIATFLAAAQAAAFGQPAAASANPAASGPNAAATAPAAPANPKAKSPPRAPTMLSVSPTGAGPKRPANPALLPGASASTAVDAVRLTKQIQTAPLAQRDALIREVGLHVDAAQRALLGLSDRANLVGQRDGNALAFQRAFTQARASEQSLRRVLQAALASTTPTTWATAQTALMQSYGEYAKAVASAESAWKNPAALSR